MLVKLLLWNLSIRSDLSTFIPRFFFIIEISHDKAQAIIDEITRAYDVAEAGNGI
jgi:hypothetical protein